MCSGGAVPERSDSDWASSACQDVAKTRRTKAYGGHDSPGRLEGKRHISERPRSIETRSRLGHWEVDTVAGSDDKLCIVTLVERKSKLTLIGTLKARTAKQANSRIQKWSLDGHASEDALTRV
jgi:transposase, IS30 family